jgi:hypothetical protein
MSANKRQTTVTMNQILMQKWFLLQNIKDSSWDRNSDFLPLYLKRHLSRMFP